MRKRVTIAVVVALVLALSVPVAFAALSPAQEKELKTLYSQQFDLQKKMIQERVDLGWITQQQADLMIKNLEARKDYLDKNGLDGQYGPGYGPGFGPGGFGCGGRGGVGLGAGYGRGMMGGWGW